VTDVWVAGQRVLKSGKLTSMNMDEVMKSAARWQKRLAAFEK
jgi:hypothetical protein